jgi:hypothetical protein
MRGYRSSRVAIALAALGFLLAASILSAVDTGSTQDFENSIFGAGSVGDTPASPGAGESFDSRVASGERAKTEYLVGGTVVVSALDSMSEDSNLSQADARGKLFGKVTVPDYGSLYLAYSVIEPFYQGYSGSLPAPEAADPYAPQWALSEAYYSFDVGKKLFVRLGNQLISWGPSQVWTPVDFINLEKADSFSTIDVRKGKPGLRLHAPFSHGNAFLFADFSDMAAGGAYGDPYKTVNVGGRIDFTVHNFEFGLTGYDGYRRQGRAGVDFSGRLFATTLYGECAYAPEYSGYDDALLATLGFSKTLDSLKRWTLTGECFYNSPGEDLSGLSPLEYAAVPAENRVPLYEGMLYGYASIAATQFLSQYLAPELSVLSNIDEGSFRVKLAEAFSFPRMVPFTLSVAWAGGAKYGEFTRYTGSDAVTVEARTTISF